MNLTSKQLSAHLKRLVEEGLVKREIQGKYIVYVVLQPQTFLEMRKTFREQLNGLLLIYWDCLDKETGQLLKQVDEVLKKSISQPEPKALGTKYLSKTIPFPDGAKVKQDLNLYEKPRIKHPKPKPVRGRPKTGKVRVN